MAFRLRNERVLGAYSGWAVPDSHRLPYINARALTKHLQISTGFGAGDFSKTEIGLLFERSVSPPHLP